MTHSSGSAAMVYLVAGGVGAGKSTRARALAEEVGGIRLSVDELMRQLYGDDEAFGIAYDWMLERVVRCESLAVTVASRAIHRGVSVVLDFGFLSRAQRERVRSACEGAGLVTRTLFLDVSADERWRRVQSRNRVQGATFAMQVSREMFDFCEGLLEPPTSDEVDER